MQQKKMLTVLKLYFAVILTNITKYEKGTQDCRTFSNAMPSVAPIFNVFHPVCGRNTFSNGFNGTVEVC